MGKAWSGENPGRRGAGAYRSDESSRRASEKRWQAQNRLRQQLLDVFPTWDSEDRPEQHITLHLGPTNSGKTFNGINHLIDSGSGWYLSPLRLLAHEVYETLNQRGARCSLLTGEEAIEVEGAAITAATIEMFNPARSGSCIIIDEAHMISDSQRGWAWTRAIMENRAADIHIAGSPIIESLISRLAEELGIAVTVEKYERLVPLDVSGQAWSLNSLPPRTILVAFSREMVLALKTELERGRRSVSVVYGNLPPEVRLKQAERFASGEAEICVATDAIGMGLNLPADHVCFFQVSKFDGVQVRTLTSNEIKQIGGRAGRYGLSEQGVISALKRGDLSIIRNAINTPTADLRFAYVAPTPESIKLLPGKLAEKLQTWMELKGIPPRWKELLKPVDVSGQIDLAKLLSQEDVEELGEDAALLLINAPCSRGTEQYWKMCARAIIRNKPMPAPASTLDLPDEIGGAADLEAYETAIRCADVYLWLSQRKDFARFALNAKSARRSRYQWSMRLDEALQKKVDTARRCKSCGKKLSVEYRFNVCRECYFDRRFNSDYGY